MHLTPAILQTTDIGQIEVGSLNSSADSVNGSMYPRGVESARFLHMLSGVDVPEMDDIEIRSQQFF